MISPVNYSVNETSFNGTKKTVNTEKHQQKDKKTSSAHCISQKAAAGIMALTMPFVVASCSKNTKPTYNPESTTTIGQGIEAERELESAREEYNESVKAEEDKIFEDYSKSIEEDRRRQGEQVIKDNGIDRYVDIDLDNDTTRAAYKEIKQVLQNLGSTKVKELAQTAGEYGLDPKDVLILVTQQGGIPSLSDYALQDAKDKYPEVENAGKTEQFVAYYSVCDERANGNSNKAVKLFTGSEQNLDNYRKVYEDLTSDMINALADNDAVEMFHLTHGDY